MPAPSPTGLLRALVLGASLLGFGAGPSAAQTKPRVLDFGATPPASVIYIGNSFVYYNNGISGHVTLLLRSAEPQRRLRSTLIGIGGSGFDWHDVASYFRPNAVGRYSIDEQNVVTFNRPERLFDVAVLMDCSQCPVHPDLQGIFYE